MNRLLGQEEREQNPKPADLLSEGKFFFKFPSTTKNLLAAFLGASFPLLRHFTAASHLTLMLF